VSVVSQLGGLSMGGVKISLVLAANETMLVLRKQNYLHGRSHGFMRHRRPGLLGSLQQREN